MGRPRTTARLQASRDLGWVRPNSKTFAGVVIDRRIAGVEAVTGTIVRAMTGRPSMTAIQTITEAIAREIR